MAVIRVRYRERQPLRAGDLSVEQDYRTAMRRRHNIAHHGWGIVYGLALVFEGGDFFVQPGMAVDGYGRELIVPKPVPLPHAAFDQLQSDTIAAWLLYGRVPVTPSQRGRWECGPGQHSRWYEEVRLRLTPMHQSIDPRRPGEVPATDLGFGPQGIPPDCPDKEWLVYLGQVERPSQPPVLENRPYVTFVGESVSAPSEQARMSVGSERESVSQRFGVSIRDVAGAFANRLAIDRAGNTTVRGKATLLQSDLIIDKSGAAPAWGVDLNPPVAVPKEAAPWQLYHATVPAEPPQPTVPEELPHTNQLRLEIFNPGDKGDPTRYLLAIGHFDEAAGHFVPCLSVKANCSVTVTHSLRVEGQVIPAPIPADPTDPDFQAALLDRWAQGLAAGGTQVDPYRTGALQVTLQAPDEVIAGQSLTYTVTIRNPSTATVTNIHAYATLTIRGTTAPPDMIRAGISLRPSGQELVDNTVDIPGSDAGTMQINVMALGVGSVANVVYGAASKTVAIVAESGPIG